MSDVIAPPPAEVMDTLRDALASDSNAVVDADVSLELVQAVRALAVKHGAPAVRHCVRVIDGVRLLLDEQAGA